MGQAFQPVVFDHDARPERIAAWIMQHCPIDDAEAVKLLHARFPDRPLSLRLAALAFLAHRQAAASGAAVN
jgi:hypothetical protein